MDSAKIKQIARDCGVDLIGIASRDRIEGLVPEGNPTQIMPHMKSVIVLGYQVLRGALRGIETGSCWNSLGGGSPLGFMSEVTYNFCRHLESAGWECVPLHSQSKNLRKQGVSVAQGKPEPDVIVDMNYLAYAAGLGHLGEGKLFLSPEYGPRQYFMGVVTDLELQPDPLFAGNLCEACGACLKACPARAYDAEKWAEESFPAGLFKWHPVHIESCRICKTGSTGNPYDSAADPNRLGAACGRACVAHLEASGRLKCALKSSFRENE
ncbi:MAG: hypothetical protein A2X49_12300 [Lentisphaerae bacterium GWF2_52_8]|nr:MAG: hypothetical protein A2X49_12300 [Lentisphaerae bacterium GWF2_52_8]